MSDSWLGFSLALQLSVGLEERSRGNEEDKHGRGGRQETFPNQVTIMPLRPDGSVHLPGPLIRNTSSSSQDWRYGNSGMTDGNGAGGGPRLENLIGHRYSNTDSSAQEECKARDNEAYQTDLNEPMCGIELYNADRCPPRVPEAFRNFGQIGDLLGTYRDPDGGDNGYGVLFAGATSVSGFKSLMRQYPCNGYSYGEKSDSGVEPSDNLLALCTSNGMSSMGSESDHRKRAVEVSAAKEPGPRKTIDTFGQRTSQFRGVTRHRWTGRYEAHLWDNSCRKEGQSRKGRQVYLGGYDNEEKAARAYDLAALKYWGTTTHTNFPLVNYEKEVEEMKNMTRHEYVANLRRKSSGFSRGASVYRGVTRHHQHGRWQARIGRVAGNKDLYLGTFSIQEEAAEAYDIAAIKFRGTSAVTNFDISRYDVKRICSSSTLTASESAKSNDSNPNSPEDQYDNDISSAIPNLIIPVPTAPHQSNELTDLCWSNICSQSSYLSPIVYRDPYNEFQTAGAGYYRQISSSSASQTASASPKESNKDRVGHISRS